MKKILIAVVILFVLFAAAILIIGRTFYPDNIAETSLDGGEKGLKTRNYKTDLLTALKSAKEIIPTLSTYGSKWKLVEYKDEDGSSSAKVGAEVPVLVFTDDLTVKFEEKDDGVVQVNVRSESRVGKSDFGENARHVRKILNALDAKFSK
ncbi:MAG: DUF1499 domain-containing protein [Pyrinomonadaceae bacterium]|nr:DUF1499 domain-containing protein [Pyrinomonadaceae bacterium]